MTKFTLIRLYAVGLTATVLVALAVGLTSVVLAQHTQRLAALEPFLIDIQQTVPFSLTFTLPNTGEAVTVPSEVDIALSIQI